MGLRRRPILAPERRAFLMPFKPVIVALIAAVPMAGAQTVWASETSAS
jgi:hypothetical protein